MSTHWRAGSVMTPAKSNAPVFRSAIAQKNGWSTIISNGNGLGWPRRLPRRKHRLRKQPRRLFVDLDVGLVFDEIIMCYKRSKRSRASAVVHGRMKAKPSPSRYRCGGPDPDTRIT